jgi:adenosylcobinamide kinase / adenosylcobinamide-phosphate guanylyltransferase
METTFVIGGCRSGKSSHAQSLAEKIAGEKLYIATCLPLDDEMRTRAAHHQQQRGRDWKTLEEPIQLAAAIRANCIKYGVILVDCLTLWVSNILLSTAGKQGLEKECADLVESLAGSGCPVILVSNEVGTGIVPENELARRYRDEAGRVNQAVAAVADRVIWMVAGIPVMIKGK